MSLINCKGYTSLIPQCKETNEKPLKIKEHGYKLCEKSKRKGMKFSMKETFSNTKLVGSEFCANCNPTDGLFYLLIKKNVTCGKNIPIHGEIQIKPGAQLQDVEITQLMKPFYYALGCASSSRRNR